MALQTLLLVRHGETDWNNEKRGQGFVDIPLNSQGHKQAQALAIYLQKRPITAVYSSDLSRAMQTAQPIADALGLMPVADARLREINMGIFEGLTPDEATVRYPEEVTARKHDYWGYKPERGESRQELLERALAAFEHILADAPGPEAVIVAHGGTLKVLLHHLLADAGVDVPRVMPNTAITTLDIAPAQITVREMAEVLHL